MVDVQVRVYPLPKQRVTVGGQQDFYAVLDHAVNVKDDGTIMFPSTSATYPETWVFG